MIRVFTSDVNLLVRINTHFGNDRTRRRENSIVCRKDACGSNKKLRHRRVKRIGGTVRTTKRLSPKIRIKL